MRHVFAQPYTNTAKYWLGFLMAAGSITGDPPARLAVEMQATDREHLVKLSAFLKCRGSITEVAATRGPKHTAVRFEVVSAQLVWDLAKEATPTLATSRDFWRGIVDATGCLGIGKVKASFTLQAKFSLCGSERLLSQFCDFVRLSLGIGLTLHRKRTTCEVTCAGSSATEIIKLLYRDATVALNRKAKLAEEVALGMKKGKTSGTAWKGMERQVAKNLSEVLGVPIHRVPLSGINSKHNRGDVIVPQGFDFLAECKMKQKFAHHTIFEKARQDAVADGKNPENVMLLSTVKGTGATLVTIQDTLFYKLLKQPAAIDLLRTPGARSGGRNFDGGTSVASESVRK